jgi:hypothetical protein
MRAKSLAPTGAKELKVAHRIARLASGAHATARGRERARTDRSGPERVGAPHPSREHSSAPVGAGFVRALIHGLTLDREDAVERQPVATCLRPYRGDCA